jgi:hypothetical protein
MSAVFGLQAFVSDAVQATAVDPGAAALFLMAAFVLAGIAQVTWLASRWSHAFLLPLDGGCTVRGRRIFGDNKTVRGLIVMVPATALSFVAASRLAMFVAGVQTTEAAGLWPLSAAGYAAIGALAGLGFMLGELPNSFVKRQLGVAPGKLAVHRAGAVWQLAIDRVDSGLGMLAALSLAVDVPWRTWALVVFVGWALHWSFSVVLFRLRVKPRPA